MLTNGLLIFIGIVCSGNLLIGIANMVGNSATEHELEFMESEYERAVISLNQAAEWFDDYAVNHFAKNTDDSRAKALVNQERAAFCREAVR